MSSSTKKSKQTNPNTSHTWESVKSDANWSAITEDEDGNIISADAGTHLSPASQIRLRRKRLSQLDHAQSSRRILRDMIRYMYLIIDLSHCMYEKDASLNLGGSGGGRRTRLDITLELCEDFVNEFYDQNPLSHLGMVVCRNGEAEVLCVLSGSKRAALVALGALREGSAGGMLMSSGSGGGGGAGGGGKNGGGNSNKSGISSNDWSLQNGLEAAGRSLGHMPPHGSREVLILVGSLSTCDPGDVLVETLPRLKGARIRVNCLAICAEMHVCRKICEETGGVMGVALDGRHLRDLIMGMCVPPPAILDSKNGNDIDDDDDKKSNNKSCEFVQMGFPTRKTEDVPSLIHAVTAASGAASTSARDKKLLFARLGYVCPRCKAKACDLPTDCAVCGLKLVLAPHLARSFHHLFPVPPFVEVPEDVQISEYDDGTEVHSDAKPIPISSKSMAIPLPQVASSSNDIFISSASSKIGFSDTTGGKKLVQIDSTLLLSSKDCDRCCFACLKIIGVERIPDSNDDNYNQNGNRKKGKNGNLGGGSKKNPKGKSGVFDRTGNSSNEPETLRFQCPDCLNVFCADCDAYLHDTLHNCPGCLCK